MVCQNKQKYEPKMLHLPLSNEKERCHILNKHAALFHVANVSLKLVYAKWLA